MLLLCCSLLSLTDGGSTTTVAAGGFHLIYGRHFLRHHMPQLCHSNGRRNTQKK